MEAIAGLNLRSSSWVALERRRRRDDGFFRFSSGFEEEKRARRVNLKSWWLNGASSRGRSVQIKVSCCKATGASGSENFNNSVDEALILKRKSEDVAPYLSGRCIYLVGMMGSGKTTVGKILAEVLGYCFLDRFCDLYVSDKLVEQAVGIASVAQIFKEHSEAFFRDNESEVLKGLSSMNCLVVATGGGAVVRPINWRYMKQGITVWLDVPLEALARRIAAVGIDSRPLLHQESGDLYRKAFMRLSALAEQRGQAYANADARICLKDVAAKQGHSDVRALSPTAIAIEALIKIEVFLNEEAPIARRAFLQG